MHQRNTVTVRTSCWPTSCCSSIHTPTLHHAAWHFWHSSNRWRVCCTEFIEGFSSVSARSPFCDWFLWWWSHPCVWPTWIFCQYSWWFWVVHACSQIQYHWVHVTFPQLCGYIDWATWVPDFVTEWFSRFPSSVLLFKYQLLWWDPLYSAALSCLVKELLNSFMSIRVNNAVFCVLIFYIDSRATRSL